MTPSKRDLITAFDPNSSSAKESLFGLPFELEHSEVVILPVPWEATVSYGGGTSKGPEAILNASSQVDLHLWDVVDSWKLGVFMEHISSDLFEESRQIKRKVQNVISLLLEGEMVVDDNLLQEINTGCKKMVEWVTFRSEHFLDKSKIVGIVGGEHSSALGLINALSSRIGSFGILQIDAHADLRKSYQGFKYSHASVMYQAQKLSNVERIVQVGLRDYCNEEWQLIENSKGRIVPFEYARIMESRFGGVNFKKTVEQIISKLPDKVYISFDIDGLEPSLCPNTGTPVPGGLNFDEARYLVKQVALSGKQIIGFDLSETGTSQKKEDEWDANVAARILYLLVAFTGVSQGLLNYDVEG